MSQTTPKEMAFIFFISEREETKETIIETLNASFTTADKQDFVDAVMELMKKSSLPVSVFSFVKKSLESMLHLNEE